MNTGANKTISEPSFTGRFTPHAKSSTHLRLISASRPTPNLSLEPALPTLLGTDLDSYIAHNMEEYEAEKVKWIGCEIEWVKCVDSKFAQGFEAGVGSFLRPLELSYRIG
jgi:hypothetical protein